MHESIVLSTDKGIEASLSVDVPMKHCNGHNSDFPATEEWFYPSYLKDSGRNECRECHKKRQKPYSHPPSHEQLLAIAQLIHQDEAKCYRSLHAVVQASKHTVSSVESNVLSKKLPVFKLNYNNTGMSLWLRQEDAEAYIATALNGHNGKHLPTSPRTVGTSGQCGSCGITQGNILGDVDIATGHKYGYLCTRCYKLVHDFHTDPKRIRNVLNYVEHTR